MPDLQTELQRWTRENDVGYVWRQSQGTHDGTYGEKFEFYVRHRAEEAFDDYCSAIESWVVEGQYVCEDGDTGPTGDELRYWKNLQDAIERKEENASWYR